MFIKFAGSKNSTDFTILPVELDLQILAGFKRGINSPIGSMPDIATKYEHTKINIKDCEYIKNPHLEKDSSGGDSDDEFDEDDDENENEDGDSK